MRALSKEEEDFLIEGTLPIDQENVDIPVMGDDASRLCDRLTREGLVSEVEIDDPHDYDLVHPFHVTTERGRRALRIHSALKLSIRGR